MWRCMSCCSGPKTQKSNRPKVTIQLPNGDSFEVELCETEEEFERLTIRDLWTKISETSREKDYSPDHWTLSFRDRSFGHENPSLSEVEIQPRSVIYLQKIGQDCKVGTKSCDLTTPIGMNSVSDSDGTQLTSDPNPDCTTTTGTNNQTDHDQNASPTPSCTCTSINSCGTRISKGFMLEFDSAEPTFDTEPGTEQ